MILLQQLLLLLRLRLMILRTLVILLLLLLLLLRSPLLQLYQRCVTSIATANTTPTGRLEFQIVPIQLLQELPPMLQLLARMQNVHLYA